MEVKKIQEELARLSGLVDGWETSQDIPAIERDLVLDKLRSLYEMIRFEETEHLSESESQPEEPVAHPEISIDLDDMLMEPLAVTATVDLKAEETPRELVAEQPEPVVSQEIEPEAEPQPEPIAEPIPEMPSEKTGSQPESTNDSIDTMSDPEPELEPNSESKPEPESTPEPEEEKKSSKPVESAAEEPQSREESPLLGSLFDTEGLVVRHREKRRVLMSLYETEPKKESVPSEPRPVEPKRNHTEAVVEERVAELQKIEPQQPAAVVTEEVEERVIEVIPMDPDSEPESEPAPAPVVNAPMESAPTASATIEVEPRIERPINQMVGHTTVLGEVIGSDVHTLADTMPAVEDMASEIVRREKITDLKQAIGINDKFLLIRDLFDGDQRRYEEAIDRLNAFDDLDDCIVFISEHFDWNPSSDGVKLLMELLDRKLS